MSRCHTQPKLSGEEVKIQIHQEGMIIWEPTKYNIEQMPWELSH